MPSLRTVPQQLPATSFGMLTAPLSLGVLAWEVSAGSTQLAATGTVRHWGLQSLPTAPVLCGRGISCYVAAVAVGAAVALPHADEQERAVTAGVLRTAAETGDQRRFHQAGVVAGVLHPLSWPASPVSIPVI